MASEQAEAGRRATLAEVIVPSAALAVSLIIRAAFWFRRAYTHDDFYFAYFSWLRSVPAVPGRDYYVPALNAFTELWAPVFRWAPQSFVPLDAARALVLVLSIVLLFLTYRLTLSLTGSIAWALTATAVTSCEPSFMQRIGDVRGDPIAAVLLTGAALIVVTQHELPKLLAAAVFAGLAVVFANKLVYAVPFVVIGLTIAARRYRVAAFVAGSVASALPVLLYLAIRIRADGPAVVLTVIRDMFFGLRAQSGSLENSTDALRSNPLLWLAVLSGAAIIIYRQRKDRDRRFYYAILAVAFIAVFFLKNPFFYPYNLVIIAPLATPLLAGLDAGAARRTAITAVVALVAAALGITGTIRMLHQTNVAQRRLVEWVWTATSPREGVFDWMGMSFGRRSVYHWSIYGPTAARYLQTSWFSLADEWKASGVTLMIPSYRFEWISPRDRAFLAAHYVYSAPCLLSPGRRFTRGELARGAVDFDVLFDADYEIRSNGIVLVDGSPAKGSVHLTPGAHRLQMAGSPEDVTLLYTTPRRREAGPAPCPAVPLLYGF